VKKLNKEVKEKAEALNHWILNQDVVIEFQKYERLIHEHAELVELENELKDMQKRIVQLKHHGVDCDDVLQEYSKKKKSFDENPLVYNYLAYKQEVNDLINQIQNDINRQLKKKID